MGTADLFSLYTLGKKKKVKLTLLLGLGGQDWLNIYQLYIIIIIPVFKTKKTYFTRTIFTKWDGLQRFIQKHFRVVKTYYINNGSISVLKFKSMFLLDILPS